MAAESFAIGEINQTVFSCPNCQRPLAMGAKHCPGCKTHLVRGVQLSKASVFVTMGLVVGLAIGGAAGGAALLANGISRDAEIATQVAAALAAADVHPAPEMLRRELEAPPSPVQVSPAALEQKMVEVARLALLVA